MTDITPEERERIENSRPWATFILLLLMIIGFVAGWAYMYFNMFLAHGPIN